MPPKVSKMTPQSDPKVTKFKKKSEIGILIQTTVFTKFLKGWDIRNQRIIQSRLVNIHACNPNVLFDTSNHIKYQKSTKKCSQ